MNTSNTDKPGLDQAPTQTCNSAVLFLVFNRPSTTKRVFDAIAKVRPPRLYIAADGPREHVPDDAARCNETRAISTQVDWPCEVYTRFRDKNLGCRVAVSNAIDWFFEQEPEGIVLEDDCLPHKDFFRFCDSLLDRYRDESRIYSICGHGHTYGQGNRGESYYFSRYNHCWGWASWRRAWSSFDLCLTDWPERRRGTWLNNIASGNPIFTRYWKRIFDDMYSGRLDSWAYAWTYTCWANNGLSVVPRRNLVSNIGFGLDATHTKNFDDHAANQETESLDLPLTHPESIQPDKKADKRTGSEQFGITLTRMTVTELKRSWLGRSLVNAIKSVLKRP